MTHLTLGAGWLHRFGALHESAKRGVLEEKDLEGYRTERERMAWVLLGAQQMAFDSGVTPRRALRVSCELPVHINFRDRIVRAPTLNISLGGLAAVVNVSPQIGEQVNVRLSVPNSDPLHARAQMVYARPDHQDDIRVGCRFVSLDATDAERLEMFVFDRVLERLTG